MMFRLVWDDASQLWFDQLSTQFPARLAKATQIAMRTAADAALRAAKGDAPVFEGWLQKDLRMFPLNIINAGRFSIRIGESGALLISGEPVQKYDPFSYAWAKHSKAAPHRVWLYGVGGKETWARKKLRRWFREYVSSDLPTTEAGYREQRPSYPPYIDVDPGKTAQPFFRERIEPNGGMVYDRFRREMKTLAKMYWRKPW